MEDRKKLKFVIIGSKGIGKRTLLTTGFGKPGRLSPFYIPIEYVDVELKTAQKNFQITCYDSLVSSSTVPRSDSAFIESFNATAINGADAILLCYSANDISTYYALSQWFQEISVYLTPNTIPFLVETQTDLGNVNSQNSFTGLKANFAETFKVNGLRKESVINMFTTIVSKIEELQIWTQNTVIQKNVITSTTFEKPTATPQKEIITSSPTKPTSMKDSYISPEKRSTVARDVRYSDKKEKIVLMEGSYVKRLTVVDESKGASDRKAKLTQKILEDEAGLERPEEVEGFH